MSSLKMHLAISEEVRKELNLSDDFILGSVLPDIIKMIIKDRKKTHFEDIEDIVNLDKFLRLQNKLNDEVVIRILCSFNRR